MRLGGIEKEASGLLGSCESETVRGHVVLQKLLSSAESFHTVLDIGAGPLQHADAFMKAGKIVDTVNLVKRGSSQEEHQVSGIRKNYAGNFNSISFPQEYDVVWCSHILQRHLNPNLFLKKVREVVREDGYVAIVVPPRKPFISVGHVSLWNAGMVIYHLVLAGFDCSKNLWIRQYDDSIGIIVKVSKIAVTDWPDDLCMDTGDTQSLAIFFPRELNFRQGFNGDIISYPQTPNKMKIAVLIPARFGSTRFPGKALHLLDGKPMASVVYDRCAEAGYDTFLLSDDDRILRLAENNLLTSNSCQNGTHRCAEAAERLASYDAFINVQGDMPDISVDIIHSVARSLQTNELATVYTVMSEEDRLNPNSVKLIHNGESAIWSVRAPLCYGDHHLGVYGYSRAVLRRYTSLPVCAAEMAENLEQLRWFNSGYKMNVTKVRYGGMEINTPEDAVKWASCRQ
ncbi:methyltransferase domain-containing protein [Candidatus Dependentiae bacterium]|nr:methyltransferase domain-containing protein [Candidatus Dependentiae bacterium]